MGIFGDAINDVINDIINDIYLKLMVLERRDGLLQVLEGHTEVTSELLQVEHSQIISPTL